MALSALLIMFHILFVVCSVNFFVQLEADENANASAPRHLTGSVYCKLRSCTFKPNVLDLAGATAIGTFNDTLLVTGWGILDVKAGYGNHRPSNTEIMYGSGFIEGFLTARQMEPQFANLAASLLPKNESLLKKLDSWYTKQRMWADIMVVKHPSDPFWQNIGLVLAQLDGLVDGYMANSAHTTKGRLNRFAINFLNGVGDFIDLRYVIEMDSAPDWTKFTADEAERHFVSQTHCSVLIKLLPGFENIYMSHTTWFLYSWTNRIFKHYDFNLAGPSIAAKKMSFSSYPGFLESLDDFYLLGSGLVMLQTSIVTFNKTLYEQVKPQSLFAWQRVRAANMMAKDGKEWAEIIQRYNSGTYNNEYMIIDLNKFKPNQPLQDNTLWVIDQMPGYVEAADATVMLKDGYFPSYNVPFFETVFNKIGYADYAKKHGTGFTYDLAPRAKIFRRDQGKVKDLTSMKAIMLSNDYKHDKYSGGTPYGAICARGDLNKIAATNGCYDTKVADAAMARDLQADIISGPTLGNNLPPFSWTGKFASYPHKGLPQTYKFPFITVKPGFD